jgi:hypothetical protein
LIISFFEIIVGQFGVGIIALRRPICGKLTDVDPGIAVEVGNKIVGIFDEFNKVNSCSTGSSCLFAMYDFY